jgi:endonuclease/exonuclease/phosphatase family metal-dependent hydrolase
MITILCIWSSTAYIMDSMTIKVISLNIWLGGKLMPAIVDFLRAEDADIVVLQEVYDAQDSQLPAVYRSMEVLREQLAYPHTAFAEAYQEIVVHGKIPHGNAVLSKFPITKRSLSYMSNPPDATMEYKDIPEHWPLFPAPLQHVELSTPAGTLNVFNMHGVWDIDGDSYSEQRQQMSKVLLAETAGKSNVVLTGDSNAKSSNQAMRNVEAQLQPVYGDELVTTFNMRRKDDPGYATAPVDLMYVSSEFTILSSACPDVDISDHLPLVVSLALGED